jgi:hypothetical protein|tara:strand:+ start:563 stop:1027 length:465 start_codon:yes stop_codon:yes gene_type:complete
MAIRKNKKRIDPRYFLNETTYRDLNEGIEANLAKYFVDGGLNGWDDATAKEVYKQWSTADNIEWNPTGEYNDQLRKNVPGHYHFYAYHESKDFLMKAFESQAIEQALQAYNEALAANNIGGQLGKRVQWLPDDRAKQFVQGVSKLGMSLTFYPV